MVQIKRIQEKENITAWHLGYFLPRKISLCSINHCTQLLKPTADNVTQ